MMGLRRAGGKHVCGHEPDIAVRVRQALTTPILAPILEDRILPFILTVVGPVQVGLLAIGQHGWQCPIKAVLGIPCPGCGLSTATLLLLKGRWRESLAVHAFAPVFLVGLVMIAVVSLLPGRWRSPAIATIAALERHTGVVAIVLLALVGYWGIRLLSVL
jgi:Protein of unknown function (DUF2752)